MDVLAQWPGLFGRPGARWRLADLRAAVPWLAGRSDAAASRLLRQFGLARKRTAARTRSPDPAYAAKRAAVRAALADPGRVVCFVDEVTLRRQPLPAPVWAPAGRATPAVPRSTRADTPLRVAAALDARTGRVVALRRGRLDVPALVRFFRDLVAAYPPGTRLTAVLDNWPVHFRPDLLAALEPQAGPFPLPRPPTWPPTPTAAARAAWGALALPVQLLPLPTYASWLNPIEKLWRWLRQAVVHAHPWADDLPALGAAVDAFLAGFAAGSPELLRYTGLAPPA